MADETLRFERLEIRPAERTLRVDGRAVEVGARAFDLLVALAQRRDRVVARQELLDLVWAGVVVEEHNITAQISSLRKLIGPDVIATIPGRGYRFTAAPHGAAGGDAAPAPARAAAMRTRLPSQLTPLLGRAEELAEVAALVQRERLVTVTGAGGIGKTLLAQHVLVATESGFRHGGCWIELASIGDGAQLPLRLADALDVRVDAETPLPALCASLASLSMVVALDNAEHLLPDLARVVTALLDAAPALHVLVTSQAPLRVSAERVFRVGPLAVPQGPLPPALAQAFGAVALFVDRAHAADARFHLSDADAPAAIELCRQLDGLPLAIELAAARAPLLGPRQLLDSMQHRLELLTRHPDAAAPARQQTLRSALEWSLSFLDERERAVFRRLGVMVDSASLELVQQVVADEAGGLDRWAVLDALGILVDRSLVTVLVDDDGRARYRLLESPRLLALERLEAAGEHRRFVSRHARCMAAWFEAAWDRRYDGSTGLQDWSRAILQDAGNARAAIASARAAHEADTVVAVATSLQAALPLRAHAERMELGELCESFADAVDSPRLRLRALLVAVRAMYHPSQPRSLALAGRALALARELTRDGADRWLLYQALAEWIHAAAVVAQPALEALHAALAELQAIEDPRWPPHRLFRGSGARRIARATVHDAAQPAEQLELTRRWVADVVAAGGDTAPCMGTLIDAELEAGHVDAAVQLGERALEQLAGSRDEWSLALVRLNLANAALLAEDTRRARELLPAAWPVAHRFNLQAWVADGAALLAVLEGRPRTAARLAGYGDAAFGSRSLIRHPIEVATRSRCEHLAVAALGRPGFDRLCDQGRRMSGAQLESLAFAAADSD